MEHLDDMLVALGREIAVARKRRGWTQGQLAEFSGVTKRQVGKIERGERGQIIEVLQLAEALGVTFGALVEQAEKEARRGA